MHNREPFPENETHKLEDFEILISARLAPDLVTINKRKRTFRMVNFAVPADHKEKLKESY